MPLLFHLDHVFPALSLGPTVLLKEFAGLLLAEGLAHERSATYLSQRLSPVVKLTHYPMLRGLTP